MQGAGCPQRLPVRPGYDVIVSLRTSPHFQEETHAFVLYLSTVSASLLSPGRDRGAGVLDPSLSSSPSSVLLLFFEQETINKYRNVSV